MTTIISKVKGEGRTILTEVEAKEFLKAWGINTNDTLLAKTKAQAITLSQQIGFPIVLKICSPDIIHKSDAGGVKVGIKSKKQVGEAYSQILNSARHRHPEANIEGVSVQKMAPPGVEVIIGMTKDPQFGPVIMFGLGGIWVEVLKDVSFRIIPITPRDAREMMQEIKGYPLLLGYRNQPPAHLPSLEEMLLRVSQMIEATPEIKELDINPIFAYEDGAVAVDARIVLEE
jgi:acyl-CoA synthetase (NDP forming)